MNIAFYWLTMGPYHYARMEALARRPEVTSVTVFEAAPQDDHGWQLPLEHEKFRHIRLTNRALSRRTEWLAYRALEKHLTGGERFDVFVNGAGYTALPLNRMLSNHRHRLFLWSESTASDNPDRRIRRLLKRWALSHYHYAVVAGERHEQYLRSLGFRGQLTRVGNVVEAADAVRSEGKRKELLFVGRFIPQKNVGLLIRAFGKLAAHFPDWNLRLVGDGPELKQLKHLSGQPGLAQRIDFSGFKFGEELNAAYRQASVLVLPSASEPWGLVANEALGHGCAVVVSDVCGCSPDLIEDGVTGMTFRSGDADELAEVLAELMEGDALRTELVEAGKERLKAFTPDAYAGRCIAAFQAALA